MTQNLATGLIVTLVVASLALPAAIAVVEPSNPTDPLVATGGDGTASINTLRGWSFEGPSNYITSGYDIGFTGGSGVSTAEARTGVQSVDLGRATSLEGTFKIGTATIIPSSLVYMGEELHQQQDGPEVVTSGVRVMDITSVTLYHKVPNTLTETAFLQYYIWAIDVTDNGGAGDGVCIVLDTPVQLGTTQGWARLSFGADTEYRVLGPHCSEWYEDKEGQTFTLAEIEQEFGEVAHASVESLTVQTMSWTEDGWPENHNIYVDDVALFAQVPPATG